LFCHQFRLGLGVEVDEGDILSLWTGPGETVCSFYFDFDDRKIGQAVFL
jgi:hypothetical protein